MTAVTFHWFFYPFFFIVSSVLLRFSLHSTWISSIIESADSPGLAAAYVMRQDTFSFKFVFPAVIVVIFFSLLSAVDFISQRDNL